jgi:hypothetical protein
MILLGLDHLFYSKLLHIAKSRKKSEKVLDFSTTMLYYYTVSFAIWQVKNEEFMKKIKWADVTFISLCPHGKNRLKVLYKEDGKFEAGVSVKKADSFDKEGEIIAAIYVPNHMDVDGDFATDNSAIKSMAHSHARNGGQLDLRHDEKPLTKEQAFVAESFIIQKGDPRFDDLTDDAGNKVDATGGWGAVIKLEDPDLKSNYEFEGWEGVSLYGNAVVESLKSDEKKVIDRLIIQNKEKARMDENKVLELINKALEPIAVALKKLGEVKKEEVKPEPKPEKKPEAPVFTGDPTSLEDIKTHELALKKYELMKSVDWQNPKQVAEVMKSLEKEDKKELSKEDKEKEIGRLNAEIQRLEKGSKQSPNEDKKTEQSEDERLFAIGAAAGKSLYPAAAK